MSENNKITEDAKAGANLYLVAMLLIFAVSLLHPTILSVFFGAIVAILFYLQSVHIYNDFQFWKNRCERTFASIDVIMQQRLDMIPAMVESIKKYDIHEYNTIKDTIIERGKGKSLNERIRAAQQIENTFMKINALYEQYPHLEAKPLHESLMGKNSISQMEETLASFRLAYNEAAEEYNRRTVLFPRMLVAKICGFAKLDYIMLGNEPSPKTEKAKVYKPSHIFSSGMKA